MQCLFIICLHYSDIAKEMESGVVLSVEGLTGPQVSNPSKANLSSMESQGSLVKSRYMCKILICCGN